MGEKRRRVDYKYRGGLYVRLRSFTSLALYSHDGTTAQRRNRFGQSTEEGKFVIADNKRRIPCT